MTSVMTSTTEEPSAVPDEWALDGLNDQERARRFIGADVLRKEAYACSNEEKKRYEGKTMT